MLSSPRPAPPAAAAQPPVPATPLPSRSATVPGPMVSACHSHAATTASAKLPPRTTPPTLADLDHVAIPSTHHTSALSSPIRVGALTMNLASRTAL